MIETPVQRARRIRKVERMEHKILAKRTVEEWNHSRECRPCERKRRDNRWAQTP